MPALPATKSCVVCHAPFMAPAPRKGKPPAEVCGRPRCWAVRYLSDEEWQARKRQAEAKLEALYAADAAGTLQATYTPVQTMGERASQSNPHPYDRSPRHLLPTWSELDDEAMRRG